MICPLYAKLPPAQQAKAFGPTPPGTRKVILSTNVAETSVTIPGVKYVIDCGMMKEKSYHAVNGSSTMRFGLFDLKSPVVMNRHGLFTRQADKQV